MTASIARRAFIAGLGGAAAWPLAARAQQGDRVRRIGVLMPLDENDPVMKARVSEFTQALAGLGWTVGRNVRMDLRWEGGDINRIRALAQELVGLQPDIILTAAEDVTAAVQRETRTIPIVFASGDPVARGIVPRLGRPSGGKGALVSPRSAPDLYQENPPPAHILLPATGRWVTAQTTVAP
jgi:putative ABC transport system substrate-binding protein